MKAMTLASWLLCALLLLATATAIPVSYTFTLIGTNTTYTQHETQQEQCTLDEENATVCTNATVLVNESQEQPWSLTIPIDDDCESVCLDAMPIPALPTEISIATYKVEEDSSAYAVTFKRSKTTTTTDSEDKIKIEILGPTCSETTCDPRCITCPDNSCHLPNYVCPALESYISVPKIVPKNLTIGENQVNVLVKNDFGKAINDVSAEITGFGLKTVKALPVALIEAGEKDYVFLTVNATNVGEQDVIIRVRATFDGQEVMTEFIDNLTIESKATTQYNKTALLSSLTEYRNAVKALELEYTEKKADGYQFLDTGETLKDTKSLLAKIQTALINDELAQANDYLNLIQFNIEDVTINLQNARKPKRSISAFMRENIFWISALITATAGALALYEKQRQKVAVLKEKVKCLTIPKGKKHKPSRRKRKKGAANQESSIPMYEETRP